MVSECLDDDTVARLAQGDLSPSERLPILAHADGCEDCRALLVAVAGGPAEPADRSFDRTVLADDDTLLGTHASMPKRTRVTPGDVIDHYTVMDVLGRGAMGVVVQARDTELGRDVALKLLLHAGSEEAERRLVREAQAMAQLSHPNVVMVHAVGRYRDGVYIAMELVRGQTLTRWCEARSRTWAEIVHLFVEAGQGLAAAHGVGLVHRDFKPDNVLVSEDGRVLVSDFGLAGVAQSWTGSASDHGESLELGTELTHTGTVMGTPRFMSPEQYEGSPDVDARADQFAFGVALYHALYGRYPFEGDDLAALRVSVSEGVVSLPPTRTDVPRGIWQAVERCIERDPAQRHPGMRAVLRDLRRVLDAPARRRRTIVMSAVGGSLLVGGVALGFGLGDAEAPTPCARIEERLDGIWDETRGQEIAEALGAAHDAEAGAETLMRVRTRLDDYADAWVVSARESCEATHVHGLQPLPRLEAHTRCLDERRAALNALVTQLGARPADDVLATAVSASASLPSIAACADRRPELAAIPAEVETELARLATLHSLGAHDDVERGAVALGPTLEEPRARARLLRLRGRANGRAGRGEIARAQLEAAALAAAEAGDDHLAARIRVDLLWVHTAGLEHYGLSDVLVQSARVALRRVGDPPDLRRRLAVVRTDLLLTREAYSEAIEQAEEALAAVDAEGGDELMRAGVLRHRSAAFAASGRIEEAIDDAMLVLQSRRQALGEHHPSVGQAHQTLARVLLFDARGEEAEEHLREALSAVERREGPNALGAAELLMMQAGARLERGKGEEGVEVAERSLSILERHGQGDSQHAFSVRNLIGVGYSLQGRHEDARRILRETIEARERVGNADDPAFAFDLHLYAEALQRGGHCEEAIPVYERLAELAGEESPFVAFGLAGAGICRVELEQPGAQDLLTRALARDDVVPLEDHDRAAISMAQARLRWRAGERRAAVELAEAARELASEDDELVRRIDAWLTEHDGR